MGLYINLITSDQILKYTASFIRIATVNSYRNAEWSLGYSWNYTDAIW